MYQDTLGECPMSRVRLGNLPFPMDTWEMSHVPWTLREVFHVPMTLGGISYLLCTLGGMSYMPSPMDTWGNNPCPTDTWENFLYLMDSRGNAPCRRTLEGNVLCPVYAWGMSHFPWTLGKCPMSHGHLGKFFMSK